VATRKRKAKAGAKAEPRASVPTRYTPRLLVEVARWVRANPDGVVEVRCGFGSTMTAAEWRAWFSRCLADKLNAKDPRHVGTRANHRGKPCRKAGQEYATELYRLRAYVGSRLVIRSHSLSWGILGERVKAAMAVRFADE
jgi:hypothetical protein